MSLGQKDLQCLASLLIPEKINQQSLECISTTVQKKFPKTDHFKVCRILQFLLHNNLLEYTVSRFTAVFLLLDMNKCESWGLYPFSDFLSNYLPDDANELPRSAVYVLHSIFSQPEQMQKFLKYTPIQILNLPVASASRSLDWTFLQCRTQSLDSRLPQTASCGISCVIPDEDVPPSCSTGPIISTPLRQHCLDSLLSHDEPAACQNSLRPEFIRIAPPLLPCPHGSGIPHAVYTSSCSNADVLYPLSTDKDVGMGSEQANVVSGFYEELIWLNPYVIDHHFHWDASVDRVTPTAEVRSLILKALGSALSQREQQTVIQMIAGNPVHVQNLGITPENLSNMITCNPVIAIELLSALATTSSADEYYCALVAMAVTVDILEVVNQLASKVTLPKEFIRAFICKCMGDCQSLQDKSIQKRHVRLVCLLIQSFIRNKILDVHNENILIEVQSFCVEFSQVPGVPQLYRLIKNTLTNSTGGCPASAQTST